MALARGASSARLSSAACIEPIDDDRIKLTKAQAGYYAGHHHNLSTGLVADIEGDKVRLSANADNAVLLEEERGGEGIADG